MNVSVISTLPVVLAMTLCLAVDSDPRTVGLSPVQVGDFDSMRAQYASAQSDDIVNAPLDISCKSDMVAVQSPRFDLACVWPDTAQRLEQRGWFILPEPVELETQDDDISESDDAMTALRMAYIVGGGKITLENVESKIPLEGNISMPVTREYAESTLLPRLAAANNDTLVLPCCAPGFTDSKKYNYLHYKTDSGNTLSAYREYADDGTEIISKIRIEIYENFSSDEFEVFVNSFMKNAGFNISGEPRIYRDSIIAYSGFDYLHFDHNSMWWPGVSTVFTGWINNNSYDKLSRPLIKQIANEHIPKIEALYDKDACPVFGRLLESWFVGSCVDAVKSGQYDAVGQCPIPPEGYREPEIMGVFNLGDVLIYNVKIGYCEADENWNTPTSIYGISTPDSPVELYLNIEGSKGEIFWSPGGEYMADDWIERIDIPESAKVRNG